MAVSVKLHSGKGETNRLICWDLYIAGTTNLDNHYDEEILSYQSGNFRPSIYNNSDISFKINFTGYITPIYVTTNNTAYVTINGNTITNRALSRVHKNDIIRWYCTPYYAWLMLTYSRSY